MKHLISLAALLLCSLLTFAQYSGSGNGTEDDPYLIFNETQLSQMSNFLNQEGVVFKLMKDLNLTSWIAENSPNQGWMPIGVASSPFKGKFLGNNKKISGLSIQRSSEDNVGFFGYIERAVIKDLTLKGASLGANNYVGTLVGQSASSTICNITVEMTGAVGGTQFVGGMAGKLVGTTLSDIKVSVTDGVFGSLYIGGLAGQAQDSNIENFNVTTDIDATDLAGGVIGQAESGTFKTGSMVGDVIATSGCAGGFAGKASTYTLQTMTVCGEVKANGSECRAGGMVAISGGTTSLTSCIYKGDISGTLVVGGINGELVGGSNQTFTSCFSKGKITNDGDYTGGIVAISYGACIAGMESCSHFGDITGKNYVGGIVGSMLSTADSKPILHTHTIYNGINYDTNPMSPSGTLMYTTKETIQNGNNVIVSINNCAAIGNIVGNNYVGGLIGVDLSSYGYSSNAKTASYATSWSTDAFSIYLFRDNAYTGTHTYYGYDLSYTYYEYFRNFVSYSLCNNYYSGTIVGLKYIGGLVGQKGGGELKNNYTDSIIYGDDNVGGIVGSTSSQDVGNMTSIKSNVSICSTLSATSANIGRVYGSIDNANYTDIGALGSAEGNRSLAQTKVILQGVVQEVEDDLQNGTSIGPSLLRLKATYVSMGWDFETNWDLQETECYPYKKYQAAPPVIESDLVSQATSISGKSLNGGTVYLYYKDREAVQTTCNGHQWSFSTDALQSGAQVQIYADVEGMTPSYFTSTNVGYPGSGTEDDPYRIYTAEDLQGASNLGYYKVMNDIDLTAWIAENSPEKGWPAVGRNSGESTYIDGDGHKISGLWIEAPDEDFTGLFSNFSAGQIKNLNVEVAAGKKVRGGDYTGIMIGRNANGRIVNCSVSGDVEGTAHVGGVAGYIEASTVSAISFDGSVGSTADNAYVGGLAGQTLDCTITSCNIAPSITTNGSVNSVGGLIGYTQGGTISKSNTDVTINVSGSESNVGGLAGYSETPIAQSLSTGSVKATGDESYTGGLVGYAKADITNSYSTATANGTLYTAGLVAYSFNAIDKCYAKGDVYGVNYGGGVVAELDGSEASLTNSVAGNNKLSLTAQTSWGCRVIGGYKNGAADPDESNYALSTMQVSLNSVPQTKTDDIVEGQARTAAQLMQSATYMGLGWDFSNMWGIDEGQMFPYLLWEIDINPVADISLNKTSLLIAVGNTETLSASVLPLGATNKRLAWTSSNTNVATVADGVVTAVSVGTAVITATSTDGSNISATCNVTVTANHDAAIAELQANVDHAQELYDNSTEGENIGQYASGARAELLATINSVKAQILSTMSSEAISQCTNDINAALDLFQSKKVTAGEDTDIANLNNVIYLERVEAAASSQLRLSVKMKNNVEVQGYQFDIYLPDGVTVATDEDGFALAELSTARTTTNRTNYFDTATTPDGALRVLCGSSKGYTFSGNDGEVAVITVNISSNIEDGEHPIILKAVKLSDKNSVPYPTDYVKSTLVISSYMLGDVNADQSIDVADFIGIANYILGNAAPGFVEKAADVNEDNSIDVADFIGVANMILHNSTNGSQQAPKKMAPRKVATDVTSLENAIYIEPIEVGTGTQQTLSVKMKNANEVAGFEFNLKLPDGFTFATDVDDMVLATLSTERTTVRHTNYFDSAIQQDGTLKVLCGTSTKDPNTNKPYAFEGNDGEVAQITINVPANYVAGQYPVYVLNAIISDPDAGKTELQTSIESTITVNAADSRILLAETSVTVPETKTNVDVRVKRTIKANEWSTICLPFSISAAQMQTAFGNDVEVELADFKGYETVEEGSNVVGINVNFATATAIAANHPYIIKVSKPVTEILVDGVDIIPEDEPTVATVNRTRRQWSELIGTYVANTTVPEKTLFLSGNKFYYSTGATKMKAFRAYFDFYDVLTNVDESYPVKMMIDINGEETGIENMVDGQGTKDNVYDLGGRKITKPQQRGVYIVNGQKVIVK